MFMACRSPIILFECFKQLCVYVVKNEVQSNQAVLTRISMLQKIKHLNLICSIIIKSIWRLLFYSLKLIARYGVWKGLFWTYSGHESTSYCFALKGYWQGCCQSKSVNLPRLECVTHDLRTCSDCNMSTVWITSLCLTSLIGLSAWLIADSYWRGRITIDNVELQSMEKVIFCPSQNLDYCAC